MHTNRSLNRQDKRYRKEGKERKKLKRKNGDIRRG
jgi:hypothetical protein